MTSVEGSAEKRAYGEGSLAKLDQIKENRRIERLDELIAKAPLSVIIGDPYKDLEGVQVWTASTGAAADMPLPRRDGSITDGNTRDVLDVATRADDCCVTEEEAIVAEDSWAEGEVLVTNPNYEHNRPALVIPGVQVTLEQVGEALGRHFDADVSLVGVPAV